MITDELGKRNYTGRFFFSPFLHTLHQQVHKQGKKSLVQWLQRVLGELPEYPWTGTFLCQATWLQFELYSACSVDQRMHSLLGTCCCCKVVTKPTSLGVYHCWSGSRNLDQKDKDKSPPLYCSFYHQWRERFTLIQTHSKKWRRLNFS